MATPTFNIISPVAGAATTSASKFLVGDNSITREELALAMVEEGLIRLDDDGNIPVDAVTVRTGTAAELAAITLDEGEIGIETDTGSILAGIDGDNVNTSRTRVDYHYLTAANVGTPVTLDLTKDIACVVVDLRGNATPAIAAPEIANAEIDIPIGYEIRFQLITDGALIQYIQPNGFDRISNVTLVINSADGSTYGVHAHASFIKVNNAASGVWSNFAMTTGVTIA